MVNNFMIENELQQEIDRQINSRRNNTNDNNDNNDTIQLLPIEQTRPTFRPFFYDIQDSFRNNSSEA